MIHVRGINWQGGLWLGFFAVIRMALTWISALVAQSPSVPAGIWGVLCTSARGRGLQRFGRN